MFGVVVCDCAGVQKSVKFHGRSLVLRFYKLLWHTIRPVAITVSKQVTIVTILKHSVI